MNQQNIQQQAQNRFEKLGWPHRKMEGWQWSDFAQEMKNKKNNIAAAHPDISQIDGVQYDRTRPFSPPDNMDALTAFNIAHGGQSASIAIPQDAHIAAPIHIKYRAGLSQMQITLGEGARATIYEHINEDGFSHVLTRIKLQPRAQLDHIRVFDQPATAISGARLDAHLGGHASWQAAIITSGAKLQRIDHRLQFLGEYASAQCNAAMLAGQRAHSDIGIEAHHGQPHCQSVSTLRAVLSDAARGNFRSTAHVAEGAEGSDVRQLCKALLLSDDARMNAKPQLNIYNDDILCAHGVAIGALDPLAVFYLRARAISESEAKRILITAFISSLFDHVPSARDSAQNIALAKLSPLISPYLCA